MEIFTDENSSAITTGGTTPPFSESAPDPPEIDQAVDFEPDPPALTPVAPFNPVWPMPTVGSDQAIEVYTKARGQTALVEHQNQMAMVLGFIKDAVRDCLTPHLLLDALQRANRFHELYGTYAQRTAKIARCLNVEYIAPIPPEVPDFVQFLANGQNTGILSRDALGAKIAEAGRRVAECEKVKRTAADAFSDQTRLAWGGEYRKPEVMKLDRYFATVRDRGCVDVDVVVRPATHEWAIDAVIRQYDAALIDHQRAVNDQAVLQREEHKADDLALSAARRAIDENGGIDGIYRGVR